MGDLPRRVPCGAAGEFSFFQQNGVVAPAFVAEVVGKAHTHDAAPDDHDPCVCWKISCHGNALSVDFFSTP